MCKTSRETPFDPNYFLPDFSVNKRRRLNDSTVSMEIPSLKSPQEIEPKNLAETVNQTVKKLQSLSYLSSDINFRSQLIEAARIWWIKSEKIEEDPSRQKVHKLCVKIIRLSEQWRRNHDPYSLVSCSLARNEQVDLNPIDFELLRMASPIFHTAFSPNSYKEFYTRAIELPNITQDVLEQILLMIKRPEAELPDTLNPLEFFTAVHYLQINCLEKKVLEGIKHRINEVQPENCLETLITYQFFYNNPHKDSKEIENLCLLNIIKYLFLINEMPKQKFLNLMDKIQFDLLNKQVEGFVS